jgi:hypothetical protein
VKVWSEHIWLRIHTPIADCCQHDNEPLNYKKDEKFQELLGKDETLFHRVAKNCQGNAVYLSFKISYLHTIIV